jgi:hypothetical protein
MAGRPGKSGSPGVGLTLGDDFPNVANALVEDGALENFFGTIGRPRR